MLGTYLCVLCGKILFRSSSQALPGLAAEALAFADEALTRIPTARRRSGRGKNDLLQGPGSSGSLRSHRSSKLQKAKPYRRY